MARFFIDRPIFAWVIAIVIMLAGALSVLNLPVAQYPQIAPPTVQISATYPGASAKTVEDTVTQVIEQNMKGIDHLTYMSSTSDSSAMVAAVSASHRAEAFSACSDLVDAIKARLPIWKHQQFADGTAEWSNCP